jgi:pyridoxamine 5'-phosphate oxidase-like protein
MYESDGDLRDLQGLLDVSYASAGRHLRSIYTPERRIPAEELPELLPGVQVISLATVTPRGEPRVAPVDGLFYRAQFWFGSAHDSSRFFNIRARPSVSASIVRGADFAVIVHGTAVEIDTAAPASRGFHEYCLETYGDSWEEWGAEAAYARIEPWRMFTYATGR